MAAPRRAAGKDEENPALGFVLTRAIAKILAYRLELPRARPLDQYALHGGPYL